MLQQTLAVFLVLGLLLAALWMLRRQGLATYGFVAGSKGIGRRNSDRRLRLVERLTLTPQHSLHLISIAGQFVLFSTSPAGCQPVESALLVLSADQETALKSGASC